MPAGDNQETKNEDEQQEGAAAAPKRRFIDEKKVEKVWPLIITKVYKGLDRLGRGAGWLVTFFFRRAGLLKDNERLIFSLQALQEEDRVTISELTAPAAMKTVPEWIANNPFKAFFLAVLLLFFVQGDVTIKQEEKKNGGTNQAGLPGAGANEGGA